MLKLTHKNSLTSLLKSWKKSPFLPPAAVVWRLQAASIRPPEGTLRHSKTAPNYVPKPSLTFFWIPRKKIVFYLLQLLFGGSKLQASGLQNGPFATAKQHLIACRNRAQTYRQKLPNVPSEFLEKISFSVSCSCCLVAPSCKHQASRTDPSPQQNST